MANLGDIPTEGPESHAVGITRRQALKKGAIFGGALAWATPVVQVIGMKPAFAQVASEGAAGLILGPLNNGHCYEVTQAEYDCFQANCSGDKSPGCLNNCLDEGSVGQRKVDCP